MEVIFEDEELALLESENAYKHFRKLPVAIVRSAIKKISLLRAATCKQDLLNLKSLRYEKLAGNFAGYESIRLNRQWRMLIRLEEEQNPPRIRIFSILDYH